MDRALLTEMVEKGHSQYRIAKVLGISQTTVRYWLKKFDLGTKRIPRCTRCGETDPSKFTPGRYSDCKKCRNRLQIARFQRYKKKAVAHKGGSCEICGYNRCMAALDFHHKDPAKKDPNWRLMRNWTFERIKDELEKCLLVCRNCHAEIHYGV
jgi:transposase